MDFSLPLVLGHRSPPKPCVSSGTLVRDDDVEIGHGKVSESKISFHAFSFYVGNIPLTTTKQWISDLFEQFGSIIDIFLSKN